MKKTLCFSILFFILLFFEACGRGYLVPYSLQPNYWKFKKMCKMQYDFYGKGVGNEEFINKYRNENGFNEGIWYNGRYEVKGPLWDLHLEEQWINCDCFYKEWDKKYLSEQEWDKKYLSEQEWDKKYLSEQEQDLKFFKGLMEIEEKGGSIKTLGWDIEEVKKKVKELEISIKAKAINNEK